MPSPGEVYERVCGGKVSFEIRIRGYCGQYIESIESKGRQLLWTRPADFARYVEEGKLRLKAALSAGEKT